MDGAAAVENRAISCFFVDIVMVRDDDRDGDGVVAVVVDDGDDGSVDDVVD